MPTLAKNARAMTRSTRTKPRASNTPREGYKSLDNNVFDDEDIFSDSDGTVHEVHHENGVKIHGAGKEQAQSSDNSSTEDEANIKLLPLKIGRNSRKQRRKRPPSHDTPTASRSSPLSSDVPGEEERDIGKYVEEVLERERTMLSESFDTDLEDANSHLILSDYDSDDSFVPTAKRERKKLRGAENWNWRSGWKSVFPVKKWWHVFPLVAVALLVIWLAMEGLSWSLAEPARDEYVWVLPLLILAGLRSSYTDLADRGLDRLLMEAELCTVVSDSPWRGE